MLRSKMFLSLMIILSTLIGTNARLLPQLDEKHEILLDENKLSEHNKRQNIECNIKDPKFYEYTDHNFHTPKSKQVEDKTGFYHSVVFVNQEIEYAENKFKLITCLGVILKYNLILTFTNCLKPTKLQTVVRYGAMSNNCSACSITVAKRIFSNKEISLISLKFPIKYSKTKDPSIDLSQPVQPACVSNLNNRNLSLLSWTLQITHGFDDENIDRLFHKPIQFGRLNKRIMIISYRSDKVVSESFIFKAINEKLYLVGLCNLKNYENYYCYNINKYKKFINDTIDKVERIGSKIGRSLADNQWKIFNLDDNRPKKKNCS